MEYFEPTKENDSLTTEQVESAVASWPGASQQTPPAQPTAQQPQSQPQTPVAPTGEEEFHEGADGTVRHSNGKMVASFHPAHVNQDDPSIPKGGFAAQKQAEMDALKPGEKSEATKLTEMAWNDALKRQRQTMLQGDIARQEAAKAEEANVAQNKRRQVMDRRIAFAEAANGALEGLKNGSGVIKTGSSGRRYRMVQVGAGALKTANDRRRASGGQDVVGSIIAYQEVDSNGKPIGQPMIATRNMKDGQSGKGEYGFRKMGIADIEGKLREAYRMRYNDDYAADTMTQRILAGYGAVEPKAAGGGNWHENVANINAASRERIAGMNNQNRKDIADANNATKVQVATIGADGKVQVAETNANALLEKTQMQVKSYAEKNMSEERRVAAKNEANKWIAELKSNTSLKRAELETKSKERIETARNEANKAIAEGKSDDWLMGKQLEYDAKIAAVEAAKMSEAAKNELKKRLEAEKNAVTLEVAKMRQATEQDKLDLGWAKEDNAQTNAEVNQDQEQQKIDNDKEWKQKKIELERELAEINARERRTKERGGAASQDDLKRKLDIQKLLLGGGLTSENRQKYDDELNDKDNQEPIKKSDNISHDESQSTEYPGYTNGKAKRAIAAGWTWNAKTKRFEPPKGK